MPAVLRPVGPQLDEDYLILSTIHSAKGQEWDAVFVLNLVDGCIPSDMASGRPEQIDEERRLLYVAMTRAREHLHLLQPLRFYLTHQPRHGRGHVMAPRSRFLPDEVLGLFTRRTATPHCAADAMPSQQGAPGRHWRPPARYVELTRLGPGIASAIGDACLASRKSGNRTPHWKYRSANAPPTLQKPHPQIIGARMTKRKPQEHLAGLVNC